MQHCSHLDIPIWPTCSASRRSLSSYVSSILNAFADSCNRESRRIPTEHNANILQYSEYGCNKVQPRVFTEVPALYGPQMTALSGGLVYEYSQEEQDYGLVVINSNGSITLRQDYDNLQKQYNSLDKGLLESTNPSSTNIKPPACASSLISAEQFSKNFTIPVVCPGCQSLIDNGIKDAKNARLVDVSATKPKQQVYGTNGAVIQGLELTKLTGDGVNGPGQQMPTSSITSGAPAQPSESKKGAATQLNGGAWAWLAVCVAVLLM
jgi:hypothetical protein